MFTVFYRNGRLLILTIILLCVWGISSYFALPRLEDPPLSSRDAIITTVFPGADAKRVEALVTEKIEDELKQFEEINKYSSISRVGTSLINISLVEDIDKNKIDLIWSRVRSKLDEVKAELPAESEEPELEEVTVKAYSLITALTWQQDESPNYLILRRQAEVLKERLEGIPGTEEVEIFGDPQEEILVEINPQVLASYNLTVQELSQQIAQSDSKIAAGLLRSENNNLLIEVGGELNTLARIREIPINFGSQGQFVPLKTIATVTKGIREPADELALINGYPAIAISAYVQSGQRLDIWANTAKEKLEAFQQMLPNTIGLPVVFDQSSYVEKRLNGLILNLLLGVALVFSVTVVMMGWRSGLIVGSALPLSVMMVFGSMNWLGIPLHQMSITGLIVALGILIDNAIIMVDEVTTKLKEKQIETLQEKRRENNLSTSDSLINTQLSNTKIKAAISDSIKTLAIPLSSSTLTTVLAFLPVALLPGGAGEFVGTIAITIIIAVCCSLFICLTIIPALTAKLHRYFSRRKQGRIRSNMNYSENGSQSRPPSLISRTSQSKWYDWRWLQSGLSNSTLTSWYKQTLKWSIRNPIWSILLALLVPIIGFIQAGSLEQQFFPAADRDQIHIEIELSSSASLAQTQSLIKEIRQQVIDDPEVKEVYWLLGKSIPRFYYNLMGGREQESNYAQALVQLHSLPSNAFTQKLQAKLDEAFPSARILVRQLEQGPPFEAPIEMRIYGSNLETLKSLGERARGFLVQIPEVTHTRASLAGVEPQLQFQLDEEQVRLAGLDNRSIAQQLDAALEGAVGGSVLEATEELPIRVRLSNQNRGDLTEISSLDLLATSASLDGTQNNPLSAVPISTLGKLELKPELAQITHYNGQRVNTIQAFLESGVLPAQILSEFQKNLTDEQFPLPSGYDFEFGGESEEKNNAVGGLISTVGVLLIIMVATLVLSLGSFKLAAIIGIVAIASFGLGFFSVWLSGYPFGFNPIIGTVGLIGIAVNDSIVVLSAISTDPIAKTGNPQAIQKVVLHSTRHVLTTTLTTATGFVPLLLSGGDFWPPLAVVIAGGVIGATVLALYLVPCAYYIQPKFRTFIK